ncbi:MAG: outer membrane protein transport protein [Pseudomonadota bacterium]
MNNKKILHLSVILSFTLSSSAAFASAFQSFEQNASDLGDAYSGIAAIADDASTEFANPAGLTRIKHPEVAASTVLVDASSDFTATGATSQGNNILNTAASKKDEPLGLNPLPAFHYATPLTDRVFFGLGVTVPFGLSGNYDKNNAARYFATRSKLMTLNIGPSLAWKIIEPLSIGAGFDVQYLRADLDQQVDAAGILQPNATNRDQDATIKNTADDWGVGYHLGLLYQMTQETRMGFLFRSPVHYHLEGKSKVTYYNLSPGDQDNLESKGLRNSDIDANMAMPAYAVLSLVHDFNREWTTMSSVSYTHWSRFQDLTLRFHSNAPPVTIKENFHNTLRYALGANYRLNDRWLFRLGTAYDNSPTNNHWRTVRLPDADRIWWSLGLQYKPMKQLAVDVGYSYIYIKNGNVYQSEPNSTTLSGYYDNNYANLFGLQLSWMFI